MPTAVATMTTGAPVSFDCEGSRLFGSLHLPQGASASVGVILLSQGPLDRGGSHRLYVKLTQELVALGLPVLRFDARGVGESEGLWGDDEQQVLVLDVYDRVQHGVWKPDACAAIDFMLTGAAGPKVKRVVLGGLCGGAVTALLAGADHPAVDGIFAIGTPVTASSVTRRVADLPDAIVQRDSAHYVKKIFRPEAWRRFFSFQTDYRTLAHVFAVQIARKLSRKGGAFRPGEDDLPIFGAIQTAGRKRKPTLMVFGENDYLWHEFKEQMPRFFKDPSRLPFDLVTIPDANHILTEERWQRAMYDAVGGWLRKLITV